MAEPDPNDLDVDRRPLPDFTSGALTEILQAIWRGTPTTPNRRAELQQHVFDLVNERARVVKLVERWRQQAKESRKKAERNGVHSDSNLDLQEAGTAGQFVNEIDTALRAGADDRAPARQLDTAEKNDDVSR